MDWKGSESMNDWKEAVLQNLKDAGCGQEAIRQFVDCQEKGNLQGQLQVLSKQREKLLEKVHAVERRIDCLDYLVFQLEKTQTTANGWLPLGGKEDMSL